jgi:hypothetical protein
MVYLKGLQLPSLRQPVWPGVKARAQQNELAGTTCECIREQIIDELRVLGQFLSSSKVKSCRKGIHCARTATALSELRSNVTANRSEKSRWANGCISSRARKKAMYSAVRLERFPCIRKGNVPSLISQKFGISMIGNRQGNLRLSLTVTYHGFPPAFIDGQEPVEPPARLG